MIVFRGYLKLFLCLSTAPWWCVEIVEVKLYTFQAFVLDQACQTCGHFTYQKNSTLCLLTYNLNFKDENIICEPVSLW